MGCQFVINLTLNVERDVSGDHWHHPFEILRGDGMETKNSSELLDITMSSLTLVTGPGVFFDPGGT